MARICKNCGRTSQVANSRSKSNIATKRLQKLNLQKFKIGGSGKRQLVCTNCIRTLSKQTT